MATDVTEIVYLGPLGAPGTGITAAQWAALQAIVASETTGNINTTGNTTLGNSAADTLTVNATATLASGVTLGSSSVDALAVNATASFNSDVNVGNSVGDILTVQGHLKHKSAAPSIANGAAIGTGGSVGTSVVFGTGQAGKVTITAGTTSLTTGIAATITFPTARPDIAYAVVLGNGNANAAAVQAYAVNDSTTIWTIRFQVAPSSGQAYTFYYAIIETTT